MKGHNALERAFHLIAERTGIKTPTVYVEVESGIPMAAGLGSSAAATVAGLRMFEKVAHPLSDRELLAAATSLEGHADNAAPALLRRPDFGDCRRRARARSAALDLAR